MTTRNFITALAAAMLFALAGGPASAHQAKTETDLSFSANPVVEGTVVTLTATVTFTGTFKPGSAMGHGALEMDDDPVVSAPGMTEQVNFEILKLAGVPVACGTPGAVFEAIPAPSTAETDGSGMASRTFDTTGLGGSTIGFQAVHPAGGGPGAHKSAQSKSECIILEITLADPLPDDTKTFTQGFYGASPVGEALVDDIINGAGDPQGLCEEIVGILNDIGITDGEILDDTGPVDCSMSAERDLVALFLTGTVGPGVDDGFLPSGGGGIGNLAAQKITLLLNLNLAAILTGDDIPILSSYFINIDPVEDIVDGSPSGTFFDPVLTTGGELGTCTDTTPADGVCDTSTVTLTTLGEKVEDLDIAGTTVQEILDAADALLGGGGDPQDVNGVMLTQDDLTKILGLINESYDDGTPTGFVTAFDAD